MNQPREELLISLVIAQIVDGDAGAGEWDELSALGADDPAIWRRLADSLRDHKSFARAVNASVAQAEMVELPAVPQQTARPKSVLRFPTWPSWSGWAVAAMVTLAATGYMLMNESQTGMTAAQSTPDLLQAYLDQGRQEQSVIGELPERVLIDMQPSATGTGYDLLYLRPILERTHVPDLYRYEGRDELGRPTLVRYEGPEGPPM